MNMYSFLEISQFKYMIYSVLNYIPFLIKLPYPTCFEKTMRPNLSILQLRWYCHPYPEKKVIASIVCSLYISYR